MNSENKPEGTSQTSPPRHTSQNIFITFDDLAQMAGQLLDGIVQIRHCKFPFDVRKGRILKRR